MFFNFSRDLIVVFVQAILADVVYFARLDSGRRQSEKPSVRNL